MQESTLGNEEEQLVSLLLSKGAAESALADEMGRLKVQEEVRILWGHTHTIYTYVTYVLICNCKASMTVHWKPCFNSIFAPDCNCRLLPSHGLPVRSCINLPALSMSLCDCR